MLWWIHACASWTHPAESWLPADYGIGPHWSHLRVVSSGRTSWRRSELPVAIDSAFIIIAEWYSSTTIHHTEVSGRNTSILVAAFVLSENI
ncbi:hypothetical protein B0H16DRAFT_633233 [Mycena metata]|uniref:Secreted protein n=1 Tax=Mycena metata TaxID=1033252 RepID=A0AAD7J9W0_9AGAR|nr:hypothetical protein B0H16DRAFT_633233 [Mycena metata]